MDHLVLACFHSERENLGYWGKDREIAHGVNLWKQMKAAEKATSESPWVHSLIWKRFKDSYYRKRDWLLGSRLEPLRYEEVENLRHLWTHERQNVMYGRGFAERFRSEQADLLEDDLW